MVQVNYIQETDELEVVFVETNIPEVVKMDNGIIFEFSPTELSTIILPNFGKMIPQQALNQDSILEFDSLTEESLKIKLNNQILNIKLDLTKLENQ